MVGEASRTTRAERRKRLGHAPFYASAPRCARRIITCDERKRRPGAWPGRRSIVQAVAGAVAPSRNRRRRRASAGMQPDVRCRASGISRSRRLSGSNQAHDGQQRVDDRDAAEVADRAAGRARSGEAPEAEQRCARHCAACSQGTCRAACHEHVMPVARGVLEQACGRRRSRECRPRERRCRRSMRMYACSSLLSLSVVFVQRDQGANLVDRQAQASHFVPVRMPERAAASGRSARRRSWATQPK